MTQKLLFTNIESYVETEEISKPTLLIIVDTEEEFDWNAPFNKHNTSIKNIQEQYKLHSHYSKHNVKPNYLIDYAVANQKSAYQPLLDLYSDNLCDIGTHLQPWVNPPFDEVTNDHNSFPGNLPFSSEFNKLERLTNLINDNLNIQPKVYKAGRYGLGNNSVNILNKLGYKIDASVVPLTNFTTTNGPNYNHCLVTPFWIDKKTNLLEIPLTVGFSGLFKKRHKEIYNFINKKSYNSLHLQGIFSRLHLLEKIKLSPEGHTLNEMKRLTQQQLKNNNKIFCLTYHSSSLLIGGSPYTRSQQDLQLFIRKIEQYLDFFFEEIQGQSMTAMELRDHFLISSA